MGSRAPPGPSREASRAALGTLVGSPSRAALWRPKKGLPGPPPEGLHGELKKPLQGPSRAAFGKAQKRPPGEPFLKVFLWEIYHWSPVATRAASLRANGESTKFSVSKVSLANRLPAAIMILLRWISSSK
jgi:hypothetical protein